jgi:hypothetical protein
LILTFFRPPCQNFKEFYDVHHDPYQLVNQAGQLKSDWSNHLSTLLPKLANCAGQECRDLERSNYDHQKRA